MIRIAEQLAPRVHHPLAPSTRLLYPHQAWLLEQPGHRLLSSPTGSGKTLGALWPIVRERRSALLVYPTNALAADQKESVTGLLQGLPGGDVYDVRLVDAEKLAARSGRRPKGDAIIAEFGHLGGPKLVLTNPDTLYLIAALRYARPVEQLAQIPTFDDLVIDEVHLYAGPMLANLMATVWLLICVARRQQGSIRVTLLSATLDEEPARLWRSMLDGMTSCAVPPYPNGLEAQSIPTTHKITFDRLSFSGDNRLENLADWLTQRKAVYRDRSRRSARHIPGAVILNSVVAARVLEVLLLDRNWQPRELVAIRGLGARSLRTLGPDALLIVGTSAIEVGIDLDIDELVFEALDRASFIQRLGRVGRHSAGAAWFLVPESSQWDDRIDTAEKRLSGELVDRSRFLHQFGSLFPAADHYAFFVASPAGAVNVWVLEASLSQLLGHRAMAQASVHEIFDEYVSRLDPTGTERCRSELNRIRRWGMHALQGKGYAWLRALFEGRSLRGGPASVNVFDHQEAKKWGKSNARYSADVLTVVRRGINIVSWRDGQGVSVGGYGAARKAWLELPGRPLREIADAGHLCTARELGALLRREDNRPLPSEMFSLAAQAMLIADAHRCRHVDWRLGLVPVGRPVDPDFVAAIGWNALLLKELLSCGSRDRAKGTR
ncbi:MAG: type I-D CRISPR-associated helicase Cas3' [Candidatus Binatia bacterium]